MQKKKPEFPKIKIAFCTPCVPSIKPTMIDQKGEMASALRRAEAAHGEHEKRTGQRDANWPDWYAAYLVAEQVGKELRT